MIVDEDVRKDNQNIENFPFIIRSSIKNNGRMKAAAAAVSTKSESSRSTIGWVEGQ